VPDQDFNLYTYFQKQFTTQFDKELLRTSTHESYSYAEIDRQSARIANFLSATGVSTGDRVSVLTAKSPQALCVYLACLRAGFVYQPLNPDSTTSELAYFLGDADPAVLICDPALAEVAGETRFLTLDADGEGSLIEESAAANDDFRTIPRGRDDLAALPYSSGTTGTPKGIMLTHGNLLSNTATLVDAWGFGESDRLLHALPIFHVHGLFVAIGCVLGSGAGMYWLRAFDAAKVCEVLPECTVMMGVPTYYTRLLAIPEFGADACQDMRLFVSGSAPLRKDTFASFEACTGHRILERYGMTETCMNTSNPLNGDRKPGTVGLPLADVEIRISGSSDIGDLQIRGPNVFLGYWKMPDKTAEGFSDDGYFSTGDQVKIDEDGYVSIVGRTKDLVISGGLNVYPKEVENVIDALSGVRESAVIGVPHPDFGEAVVAVVVPQPDTAAVEDEILQAARDHLANYKIPKRVVFIDQLPRNSMGKVQKNSLRETFQHLFKRRRA
jgi:malonyl-CoA/methylmalonyl-CoA synthetase